jgi:acyl carrier protein
VSDHERRRQTVAKVVYEICKCRVGDSDGLVSTGLIDSLAILRLITGLEERLGVRIPTDRVQPDDFDSIDMILETLDRVAPS